MYVCKLGMRTIKRWSYACRVLLQSSFQVLALFRLFFFEFLLGERWAERKRNLCSPQHSAVCYGFSVDHQFELITLLSSIRLWVVPLSVSPSWVTRKKTARKNSRAKSWRTKERAPRFSGHFSRSSSFALRTTDNAKEGLLVVCLL